MNHFALPRRWDTAMRPYAILGLCLLIFGAPSLFAQEKPTPAPKSESKATRYSLGATLLPMLAGIAMVAKGREADAPISVVGLTVGGLGLLVGPGSGHFYASQSKRASTGIVIRTLAGGLAVAGALEASEHIFDDDQPTVNGVLFVGGGALFLISVIYDIAGADGSADRYNRDHGLAAVGLHPCYFPRQDAVGVALCLDW